MRRAEWLLPAAGWVLLQLLLFSRLSWQGAAPLPVPVFVLWLGLTAGAEPGAWAGLLAGSLLYLFGGSPWEMGFLSLLGGLSGRLFPGRAGYVRTCLRALPLLAGWELLRLLSLWCGGGDPLAVLPLLEREYLLCAAVTPLVGSLSAPRRRRAVRRR